MRSRNISERMRSFPFRSSGEANLLEHDLQSFKCVSLFFSVA